MDIPGLLLLGSTAGAALALLALLIGPLVGWRVAAQHEEFLAFRSANVPRQKIRDALARQGWTLVRDQPGDMMARTRLSWRSWGELVSLEFRDHGALVRSRCASRSQLVDFGQNRRNVRTLIDALDAPEA